MKCACSSDAIEPILKDPLIVPVHPITRARARAKKFKEDFNELLQDIWTEVDYKSVTTQDEKALINLIHIQDKIEDYWFRPRSKSASLCLFCQVLYVF